MIRRSLDELDEKTIATALGIKKIAHRLKPSFLKRLHPKTAAAFDAGTITKACVQELTYVTPQRQEEILSMMESYKDWEFYEQQRPQNVAGTYRALAPNR